jgi:hypothetical protein
MPNKGRAIYLVYSDLADDLPQSLEIPGVLDGARYVAVKGGPKYLAVYELDSADVIQSGANRLTSILGEQIFPEGMENPDRGMAPVLQIGRMSVPESVDTAWNAWYNGEYIPGYRTVPGVIYARRYRVVKGEVRYTTVYEFESEAVPDSAEWNYQREHSSPNSAAMRDAMVMAEGSPGVYRRL